MYPVMSTKGQFCNMYFEKVDMCFIFIDRNGHPLKAKKNTCERRYFENEQVKTFVNVYFVYLRFK